MQFKLGKRSATQWKLNQPPAGTVAHRIKDPKSVFNVVRCWRKGILPTRVTFVPHRMVPLQALHSAENRKNLWPGSTDAWWKASGTKQAYMRIKRIIDFEGRRMSGDAHSRSAASDEDWEETAKLCDIENQGKPLSSLT